MLVYVCMDVCWCLYVCIITGLDLTVIGSLLVRARLSSGRGLPHMNWGIRRPPRELGGVYYSIGWRYGHTDQIDDHPSDVCDMRTFSSIVTKSMGTDRYRHT